MIKLKIAEIGTPKPVQTKYGPKEKNYIKVEGDYAGKFLNYWVGEQTQSWKVGSEVEVLAIEERDYTAQDGTLKKSYDIKLPSKENLTRKDIEEIKNTLAKHTLMLKQIGEAVINKEKVDYPEFQGEPNFDEVPF